MAESAAVTNSKKAEGTLNKLVCRLRAKEIMGKRGPLKGWGELELENQSEDPIDIRYQMSPLQYLDFVVVGPNGKKISGRRFGDQFSPMCEELTLRLAPGEKFLHDVPLLGTVSDEDRLPGVYKVQAIYEYGGIRAESQAITVKV